MGFMVEGSTGARAVAMLKSMPPGTIIDTPEFAMVLSVKPGALHQLLANAVKLRLIKKVRSRGNPCIGWALGAGNVGVTIEPRRVAPLPPTLEELARRADRAKRRQERDALNQHAPRSPGRPNWPPGFVSTFSSEKLHYQPPSEKLAAEGPDADPAAELPVWLRGLVPRELPPEPAEPMPVAAPRPVQLPLFDAGEIGEPGRARWRRLDLVLPQLQRAGQVPSWRQVSILEA